MTAATAEFYDEALADSEARALMPLETSPWLRLYQAAADLLPTTVPVIDLGCGTGRFARLLADQGFDSYRGYDFSRAALGEASTYVEDDGFVFDWADLASWQPRRVASGTVFVCLEVLEHLADDRALVSRIPTGHRLILSVPNYPSEAHVRVFPTAQDVIRRYGPWLEFDHARSLDFGDVGKRIYVFAATRKGRAEMAVEA